MRRRKADYVVRSCTNNYSLAELRKLFADFSQVQIRTVLTYGDLPESAAGQRHRGCC